eukprot:3940884-Rhodomonas_salina.1
MLLRVLPSYALPSTDLDCPSLGATHYWPVLYAVYYRPTRWPVLTPRMVLQVNGSAWAGDLRKITVMIENGVDPEEGTTSLCNMVLHACDVVSGTNVAYDATRRPSDAYCAASSSMPPFDINRADRYGNTALDDAIRENSTTSGEDPRP